MAAKSTYLNNMILNSVLKNTAFTVPATVYVALGTTNQTAANGATEVTGGSYARQSCAFGTVSGGSVTNSGAPSFTGMPSCTVTSVSVFDASTAGNLLYYVNITGQVVNVGGTFSVPASSLTITEA